MSNVRLYVRSTHRAIINQWTILINIKNMIRDLFQILRKKEKINQTINLTRAKLQKQNEIISSESSDLKSKVLNFIR